MIICLRGDKKEFDDGVTPAEIARSISEGLARNALVARVNGIVTEMSTPIHGDADVEFLDFTTEEGRRAYRHSTAHVLAQALKTIYPTCKLAIGPVIDNGFYYDVDFKTPITMEDFEKIEAEMKKIVKSNLPIERFTLPREDAIALMSKYHEKYKVELIQDLPEGEEISFYRQGAFVDLCRGPHLLSTGKIKAFKLVSIAGAYWRGDEKKKMLTRIYGTAFARKEEMDEYFEMLEEAKKRDHIKLGKEMKLFALLPEGKGFPFFLPNGMVLKNTLIDYWRQIHRREGYVEVQNKENMYTTKIDGEDCAIKPMNCPGGLLVYKTQPHSYKDLPIRMGELGIVHRHEKSGQLHGLMRVRCFTQDDAHIFMLPEQITQEIKGVVRIIDEVYKLFGFKYHVELSTRPENSIGSDEDWAAATDALRAALDELRLDYTVNEGDGAFYGPKIDFHLEDSIKRTWQCGTIQLDFQLPQRFEIEYVGEDGQKHRPIMIHRVVFGSIERFIGILIEHFAGKFPVWLAPEQVKVLPVTDRASAYAEQLVAEMNAMGLRASADLRKEKLGRKILDAEMEKVPYKLVVGDKEVEEGTVSVRRRGEGDIGSMAKADFFALVKKEDADKTIF